MSEVTTSTGANTRADVMDDKDFITFINTTATRGGATFNINTANVSKQAREILAKSDFKALAKQHINANVIDAYMTNDKFKAKLDEVMDALDITVIAG